MDFEEQIYPQITQITQIIFWLMPELTPVRCTSPQYAAYLQIPKTLLLFNLCNLRNLRKTNPKLPTVVSLNWRVMPH